MKGVDYQTGHQYEVTQNGGELHSDDCAHPSHYKSLLAAAEIKCTCGHQKWEHRRPDGHCTLCETLGRFCEQFNEAMIHDQPISPFAASMFAGVKRMTDEQVRRSHGAISPGHPIPD
jgi:hypothetical protein